MKKIFFFSTLILLFSIGVNAQKVNGIVKGSLQDSTTASPLGDATVSVMRLEDSSLISFTLTSNSGFFEIKNLDAGNYVVNASFTGLQTIKKPFSITAATPLVDMGSLKLDRIYNTLDEVVIVDDAPIRIKGDTLSFKADAFGTKPNATVEDLLKKLPGMTVERDGTVKAQGENVQKVYVDGKEFFNNDPKMATKNLTADMVDRVEVFDDMSEQAKFNGIDDGSRSKSINLKLKKDKKKGTFGKAYAGYGTKERYDAGVTANFFKGAMQTSVIAKTNNVNNIGFTVADMLGMMGGGSGGGMGGMTMMMSGGGNRGSGGGGMAMMMSGGDKGGFGFGGGSNGLTTSSQIGLNYRDTWSKLFDMNGSIFYNNTNTNNDRKSFRQTIASDSSLNTENQTLSRNKNSNLRMNFNLIYTIDSFNSIIFSPSINLQNSNTFSDDSLISNVVQGPKQYVTNVGRTINNNEGSGYNWSNNLIWRKKFRTPGRTLSLNLSNTLSNNKRDGFSTIKSRFFNNDGVQWFNRLNDFQVHSESETNNYTAGLSYTEPIARDKVLEFNYAHTDNRSGSVRNTLNRNPTTGNYDMVVDSLTNQFENTNVFDRFGTNLRIVKKKYNYQIGFAIQQLDLSSNNITKQNNLSQKYTNFFPSASFNYQFARSRNLRINYRGRTNQPSVTQLQDVTDITNYPYITKGNPLLRQEFSNNVTVSYNYFDIISFRNIFAFVTYNTTRNKISNAVRQLPGGIQETTPVNVNGVYNVSGNFNIGMPLKFLKGSNFNTTTRISYNQDANEIDRKLNYSKNLSVGEDLRFSYNKEKIDMGITAGVNYNSVNYTIQSRNNESYFTHNYSADVTYTLPKGFILASDIDYIFNTGRADGFNLNYALWNASVAKQVFKNKRGEIKASVYDILNQNTSVTRNIGINYIEDVQNSVLNRFFILSFTYNINKMGGRTMPAIMERATKGMRF